MTVAAERGRGDQTQQQWTQWREAWRRGGREEWRQGRGGGECARGGWRVKGEGWMEVGAEGEGSEERALMSTSLRGDGGVVMIDDCCVGSEEGEGTTASKVIGERVHGVEGRRWMHRDEGRGGG